DEHGAAVRVAECDVHDLSVPSGRAERGTGDAHRPWNDEPGQMPEGVVLGVLGDRVARPDRDDAGAGTAAADVRSAGGVEREIPVDYRLGPVAGVADDQVTGVPLERVGERVRRIRGLGARAFGEVDRLVGELVVQRTHRARVAGVAVVGDAVHPAGGGRVGDVRGV